MDDLINRQDAIDAIKKHYRAHDNDLLELIAFDIERLPSAQPERKKGKWIHEGLEASCLRCSACGYRDYTEYYSNYCPHCGAEMREEIE